MTAPYYQDDTVTLLCGDALAESRLLPNGSVQTIVTSPPYFGLRDYGTEGQMGAEDTVEGYVAGMVSLFHELRRVLADDGTLWLNLGDSYSSQPGWGRGGGSTLEGTKNDAKGRSGASKKQFDSRTRPLSDLAPKNLIGVPWRVALALQADGWILRSDIIWHKPNPMPESVTDRLTKSHEYLFLLAKSPKYYYDAKAIAEPIAASSVARLSQPGLSEQAGSERGNGGAKTNGNMKAVGPRFGGSKYGDVGDGGADDRTQTKSGNVYDASSGLANKRTVWTVPTVPFSEAHFAVYPPELIRPCILAGSRIGGTVLDPFSGSGTTGMVATQEGRKYIGIDINSDYLDLSLKTRFVQPVLALGSLS
jgi:DNA modification methylase